MSNRPFARLIGGLLFCAVAVTAQNGVDLPTISAIRNEGLQASQVMDHLSWVADVYGPRIAGSPAMLAASDWALKRFAEWGLASPHREYWSLGEGWSVQHFDANMVLPQTMPIIGFPISWTPGTEGPITAEAVNPKLESAADFQKWTGHLHGKIVLIQPARQVDLLELPLMFRHTNEELDQLKRTPIPRQWLAGETSRGYVPQEGTKGIGLLGPSRSLGRAPFEDQLIHFLKREGVVAVLDRGSDATTVDVGPVEQLTEKTQRTDGGTVFVEMGRPGLNNRERLLPWVTIAVEQYNRMVRILDLGIPVKIELNVQVNWYTEKGDGNGFNTIAEIPGTDLKDQVVIIGAHLDSCQAGEGATDDGAGVAAVMEAVRLLRKLSIRPRRTIRIALWGGEELGLLGSQAYVKSHYLTGSESVAEAKKVSVYFNLDNGSGRIRGVWLQNDLAAESTFEHWIEPVRDLGVTTVARRSTQGSVIGNDLVGGTDHLSFDIAGIPAFQFIQDRLEYLSRTAHSNMDFVDHASKPDLIQMSVVIAVLAYEASMTDEPLQRKAEPLRPMYPVK